MSTATNPVPTATLDTSGTARVPFARLVSVELRKMWDTRAGLWLLGSIVVVTAAFMLIFFFVADSQDRSFENFIGFAATPQGFLLPVLGILLVTQEWGQRMAEARGHSGQGLLFTDEAVVYSPGQFVSNITAAMDPAIDASETLGFLMEAMTWVTVVVQTGWLEKFPKLKAAVLESNASWLPLILSRSSNFT